ncbi:GNAT family N-acetyltransferase [Kribbella sp. NPDC059898]|uniref:GNAT family N-acetyltransferase n=1 Tax=Kribbella sp. NPDC059898 TaxID=3346995 RepID=UPI00364E8A24
MTYTLRRATSADEPAVTALIADRAAWLVSRGLDQWTVKDPARTTAATIAAGETWLLVDQDQAPIGTITMSTRADRDFWTDHDPALYLSKIATAVDRAGEGLGELLVHAAYLYGMAHQVSLLRWDVWRTNTALQDYYQRIGGDLVDVVHVQGRNSGALFELTTRMHGQIHNSGTAQRVRIEAPSGVVTHAAFHTVHGTTSLDETHDFDQSLGYNHSHTLDDLVDATGAPVRLNINSTAPGLLYDDGTGWRFQGQAVAGTLLASLRPGWVYLLEHGPRFGECYVELRGDLAPGQVDQGRPRQAVEA